MIKNKVYVNTPNKRYVQAMLFKMLGIFNSSAGVLLGPTPHTYISLLRKIIGDNTIVNYETDTSIVLPYQEKVITNYMSIFSAFPSGLMDLDLMGSIKTQGESIKKVFWNQEQAYKKRAFLFTVSLRRSSKKEVFDFLKDLIGEDFIAVGAKIKKGVIKYTFYSENPFGKYDLYGYQYTDCVPDSKYHGNHMMSFLIKQKEENKEAEQQEKITVEE